MEDIDFDNLSLDLSPKKEINSELNDSDLKYIHLYVQNAEKKGIEFKSENSKILTGKKSLIDLNLSDISFNFSKKSTNSSKNRHSNSIILEDLPSDIFVTPFKSVKNSDIPKENAPNNISIMMENEEYHISLSSSILDLEFPKTNLKENNPGSYLNEKTSNKSNHSQIKEVEITFNEEDIQIIDNSKIPIFKNITQPQTTQKRSPTKFIFAVENHCKVKNKTKNRDFIVQSVKKQTKLGKYFNGTFVSGKKDKKLKDSDNLKGEESILVTLDNLQTYYSNKGSSISKFCSGFSPKTEINIESAKLWYFLTSKNFRFYQFNIVETCLYYNTLVCLPTGLGKTFVAANVMINYYKWFPEGKIFFLAPTKPLVNQQIDCLKRLSSVDNEDIIELTGKIQWEKRVRLYTEKRIIFCTPQTMQNDLDEKRIDIKQIVLIVFDEAHRATGNYAYANIIRTMEKSTIGYRVLALSATPGNSLENIQQVIDNLCISKIEIRNEEDYDVKPYIHSKEIVPIFIPFSPDIQNVKKKYF